MDKRMVHLKVGGDPSANEMSAMLSITWHIKFMYVYKSKDS